MDDISYLTDRYDEKIAKINELDAPINFVFITDEHNRMNYYDPDFIASRKEDVKYELAVNHIRSIQYILDRCPGISMVINGGDVGDDYHPDAKLYKESVKEVYDELYKLTVPVHCVIGNHDDGLGNCRDRGYDARTHSILPKEMHSYCMKYNPTDENYYFIDVDPGFRFVFMNSVDIPYYFNEDGTAAFGWRLEISNRQAEWFEKQALQTDRKIIIFSHAPLSNAGIFGSEGLPMGVKPYDDTLNAPRLLFDIRYSPNVVANIFGHLHYDNIVYQDRLLAISTSCSLVQKWCPSMPERKIGTITETCFDVFSIKDGTVYMTRFGAGVDRKADFITRRPTEYYF